MRPVSIALAFCLAVSGCQPSAQDAAASSEADGAAAPVDSLGLPETNFYEISTPFGRMVVRLYDETPLHRDNFKKLVQEGFYDGTTFHRLINGFMIQGGDPYSRDEDPFNDGTGGPGYTVPAEFHPDLYHKRGALSAARQGDEANPERHSSGSQFYIVQGTPVDSFQLGMIEQQIRQATRNPDFHFPAARRAAYMEEGGTPFLDQQYTVFGELLEGLDVLDRIAAAPTPRSTGQQTHPQLMDRPLEAVPMAVRPLPDYQ